jgi:hypothetical protein
MKHVISLLFFWLFATSALYSQVSDSTTTPLNRSAALKMIDQGKVLVNEGKVRDALIVFREASVKDPFQWKASYWIAYSHNQLFNFGYANQYAKETIKKAGTAVDNEIYDILATSFHQLNQLDSALYYYTVCKEKLSKVRYSQLRIDQKIQNCEFAKSAITTENKRVPFAPNINSGADEYAPIITANDKEMYFTARRANSTGGIINAGDQDYLEDIYKAVWNNETKQWDSITNNLPRLNTTGHDALNWISPDGLTAVVTWNNAMTEDKNQTKSSDICEVEYTKKSSWTAPRIIVNKSINTSFFEGSATLTADGNTMYFVSDRKGEKKSTDIYVVEKRGKTWGEAVALPDSINSVGRETTPFISGDGRYLFFSSDGHTGMGGLDIFVCERTEKGWSKPVNLGPSVNTVNDETHFSINFSSKKAYCAGVELIGLKSNYNCFSFDLNTLQLPFKW